MAGGDQAREALTGAPRTVMPHGEGPSSSGGRPLPPPGAPAYLTEVDLPALLAEVERERELRDSWYERCHEAEADARRQRMRAEKAEAALDEIKSACRECADNDTLASQVTGVIARFYYLAEVERELPDAVAERIAEGHARLLAHGRRVHADHGAAEEGR